MLCEIGALWKSICDKYPPPPCQPARSALPDMDQPFSPFVSEHSSGHGFLCWCNFRLNDTPVAANLNTVRLLEYIHQHCAYIKQRDCLFLFTRTLEMEMEGVRIQVKLQLRRFYHWNPSAIISRDPKIKLLRRYRITPFTLKLDSRHLVQGCCYKLYKVFIIPSTLYASEAHFRLKTL